MGPERTLGKCFWSNIPWCVTWSVGERVTGCESAQGMGPVGRGRAGGHRPACQAPGL